MANDKIVEKGAKAKKLVSKILDVEKKDNKEKLTPKTKSIKVKTRSKKDKTLSPMQVKLNRMACVLKMNYSWKYPARWFVETVRREEESSQKAKEEQEQKKGKPESRPVAHSAGSTEKPPSAPPSHAGSITSTRDASRRGHMHTQESREADVFVQQSEEKYEEFQIMGGNIVLRKEADLQQEAAAALPEISIISPLEPKPTEGFMGRFVDGITYATPQKKCSKPTCGTNAHPPATVVEAADCSERSNKPTGETGAPKPLTEQEMLEKERVNQYESEMREINKQAERNIFETFIDFDEESDDSDGSDLPIITTLESTKHAEIQDFQSLPDRMLLRETKQGRSLAEQSTEQTQVLQIDMSQVRTEDAYTQFRENISRSRKPTQILETFNLRSGRDANMPSILVDGDQLKFVLWDTRDLQTFISKLPNLRDGANLWIAAFEEETIDNIVAVGDLKVLLTKILTLSEVEELFIDAGMGQAIHSHDYDGLSLNACRQRLWETLRYKFQTRITQCKLTRFWGPEETFDKWLTDQAQSWILLFGRPVTDILAVHSHLFRSAVKDSLPAAVQKKLDNIPGLDAMSYEHWSETMRHFAKAYRKEQEEAENRSKEVNRKLAQAMLEMLTMNKSKPDVDVLKGETESPEEKPASNDSSTNQTPAEVIDARPKNVAADNILQVAINVLPFFKSIAHFCGRGRGAQKGRRFGNCGSPKELICYGCKDTGHIRRDCPTNPWPINQ